MLAGGVKINRSGDRKRLFQANLGVAALHTISFKVASDGSPIIYANIYFGVDGQQLYRMIDLVDGASICLPADFANVEVVDGDNLDPNYSVSGSIAIGARPAGGPLPTLTPMPALTIGAGGAVNGLPFPLAGERAMSVIGWDATGARSDLQVRIHPSGLDPIGLAQFPSDGTFRPLPPGSFRYSITNLGAVAYARVTFGIDG